VIDQGDVMRVALLVADRPVAPMGRAAPVRFARAVLPRAHVQGIELMAGVSFDTCWFSGADIDGVAVQVAPLIAARAAGGEVLASDGAGALLGAAFKLSPRGDLPGAATKPHVVRVDAI
jgi:class 3 adenylate cyclase